MPNYLAFVSFFISLGPKIGQVMPLVLAALDLAKQSLAKLRDVTVLLGIEPPVTPVALAVSPEEEAAEEKVLAMMAKHSGRGHHASALGDGTILRGLFSFLKANPQLMTWFLGVLKIV